MSELISSIERFNKDYKLDNSYDIPQHLDGGMILASFDELESILGEPLIDNYQKDSWISWVILERRESFNGPDKEDCMYYIHSEIMTNHTKKMKLALFKEKGEQPWYIYISQNMSIRDLTLFLESINRSILEVREGRK
jgi:hypothetical protein